MSAAATRAAALLGGLVLLAGCAEETARPDLLLVTVDTLRADRLACYGGPASVGTGICALGDRGVRYQWAFAPAPSTAPSVASLLTSQLPSHHGLTQAARTALPDAAVTVAERLRDAGYETAAFVSNPVLSRGRGLDQGFAVYDDHMTRRERNRGMLEREAGETTDAALAWLKVARSPWFLWVHYQDPHGPYDPPRAPHRSDPEGTEPLPVLGDHSGRGGIPAYQVLPGLRSAAAYAERYLDEIRHLDLHVARLVGAADAGRAPPFVVLTADHGEAFGEDGYFFAHGHSVGLDQVRVPLLVRPAAPAPGGGRVVHGAVSLLDVAPTLLAAAGLAVEAPLEGAPLPRDDAAAAAARPVVSQHRLRAALVTGDVYYARDHPGFRAPVADPVSGGALFPLPPRVADLGTDGVPSAYRPVDGERADALERALDRALGAAPGAKAAPDAGPALDAEEREALRALGYLE